MAAIMLGYIQKSDAVIINQTMAQVSRSTNLTKDGPIIKDAPAFVAVKTVKNETSNVTIAVNESKQVGNTR